MRRWGAPARSGFDRSSPSDVIVLGGMVGYLLIRNVGNGPALDVRLRLAFEGEVVETRDWSEPNVTPGESHELALPSPFREDVRLAAEQALAVQIDGTLRDLEGRTLPVEVRLDVSAWMRHAVAARVRIGGRRKLPGIDPSTWGVRKRDELSEGAERLGSQ